MGVLGVVTAVVLGIAVLFGSGVLPRLIARLGRQYEFELLTGFNPLFMTADELSVARVSDLPKQGMAGKVCLVTGANAGLGFATARQLALQGAHVVLVGRREKALKRAMEKIAVELEASGSNGSCEAMVADLDNIQSVRDFTSAFLEKHSRLDVFVMNAGIADYNSSTKLQKNHAGIENNFAINFLGHFAMTKDLEGLITQTGREHGEARIVVVSSTAHYVAIPEIGVHLNLKDLNSNDKANALQRYGQSKLANLLFAQALSKRLLTDNVFVNAAHPGLVRTDLYDPFVENVRAWGGKNKLFEPLARLIEEVFFLAYDALTFTAEEGARTQIWLAASPEVKEQNISGKYFHPHAQEVKPSVLAKRKVKGQLLEDALCDFAEELLENL